MKKSKIQSDLSAKIERFVYLHKNYIEFCFIFTYNFQIDMNIIINFSY